MTARRVTRRSLVWLVASAHVLVSPVTSGVARASATEPGVVVDPFTTAFSVGLHGPGSIATSSTPWPGLGGVIETWIVGATGPGEKSADIGATRPGALSFRTAPGGAGTAVYVWDGSSEDSFTPSGLGGVDLTDSGLAQAFVLRVVRSSPGGAVLTVTVDSDAATCSSTSLALPAVAGDPLVVALPFASFVPRPGCASGADLSAAGAIRLEIDGSTVAGLEVSIDVFRTGALDLGDLPAPFATLLADGGPAHLVTGGVRLGGLLDHEGDGQPSAVADGDDATGADEDGVTVTPGVPWTLAGGGSVDVTIGHQPGCLAGWVDFDRSGSFGPGEQVLDDVAVAPGTASHAFAIPAGTVLPGDFSSRFRVYPRAGGGCGEPRSPTGTVMGGEVEDHVLAAEPPCPQGGCTVAAGHQFSCAAVDGGSVRCWGSNGHGQLGAGLSASRSLVPVGVVGLSRVTELAAGRDHACALETGGRLWCWGSNGAGQLGDGSTTSSRAPVLVPGLTGVVSVAAGERHTCAALAGGQLRCWGENGNGQLGDGTKVRRVSPVAVPGVADAAQVSAGGYTTCVLGTGGGVRCWGWNGSGQVGDGATVDRFVPTPVSGLTSGVARVGVGYRHTCAAMADGTARCWGYNGQGGLGNGSLSNSPVPVAVSGLGPVAAVGAGRDHTCALLADTTVSCWGLNNYGQVGDGTQTRRTLPAPVPGLTGVVAVSAGSNHTVARLAGCSVMGWGNNSQGQLGDGTSQNASLPVAAGPT